MQSNTSRLHPLHPNLDDILDDEAPFPYTLAAFIAFLDETHSLENIEFLLESKRYCRSYEWLKTSADTRDTPNLGPHLWSIWARLVERYIQFGAPRQINLPTDICEELVTYQETHEEHPPPHVLEPAVRHVEDMIQQCVLIQFIKASSATSRIHAHSTPNLLEALSIPPKGRESERVAEYPKVRKKSKLGQYLSHHPTLEDVGHLVTGAGPGTESKAESVASSREVEQDQARLSWEGLLSQAMTHTTLGGEIERPRTAPTRDPRRRWAIFTRMFEKRGSPSPEG